MNYLQKLRTRKVFILEFFEICNVLTDGVNCSEIREMDKKWLSAYWDVTHTAMLEGLAAKHYKGKVPQKEKQKLIDIIKSIESGEKYDFKV